MRVIDGLASLVLLTPSLWAGVDQATETKVQDAIKKAVPSVVAVGTGVVAPENGPYQSMATGVIISADGLILSQNHVTHQRDRADAMKLHPAGHKVRVVLHDGREVKAELLGTDPVLDLSMLKITDPGPFPFSPVDPKRLPKLGDAVLKLGHPMGYRKDRGAVARLGRVVLRDEDGFVCDCQVIGGDSGGPFFDLDSNLVGVIIGSRMTNKLANAANTLPRYRTLPGVCGTPAIAARLNELKAGKILTTTAAREATDPPVLDAERWSRGPDNAKAWRAILATQGGSAVRILAGQETVALGTVVEPGLIVTKASLLPLSPSVQLPDGTIVEPEILGADAPHDLAVLTIQAKLNPVVWSETNPIAGTFVGTVPNGEVLAPSGIVSHVRRKLPGDFPKTIPLVRSSPAQRPEAIGSTVEGRGYWIEHVEGRLAEVGVQPGDVLLSVADQPVRTHEDLMASVRGRFAGDVVTVRFQRGRERLQRSMTLRADPQMLNTGRGGDFPEVFEHDMAIEASESGGPVFDLKGQAIGVTIARSATGGVAIPADVVKTIIARLKDGKTPWPGLRQRATAPVAPAEAAKITLEELHTKLKARAEQYGAMFVEYDSVTEANVAPERLAAWQSIIVRDYQERVTVAVDGTKQFVKVVVPGNQPRWLPAEQIRPDPDSPKSVQQDVQARADADRARLQRGEANRWIAIPTTETTLSIIDGKKAFRSSGQAKRFAAVPLGDVSIPAEYLGNIGLQPVAPGSTADQQRGTAGLRLPDAVRRLQDAKVRPTLEVVDGAKCVVVEGTRMDKIDGQDRLLTETFWFDPAVNYAPRKVETWDKTRLVRRVTAHEFSEAVAGVWWPWDVRNAYGRPSWVKDEIGSPAYTVRVRVRRVSVGAVEAKLFQP